MAATGEGIKSLMEYSYRWTNPSKWTTNVGGGPRGPQFKLEEYKVNWMYDVYCVRLGNSSVIII